MSEIKTKIEENKRINLERKLEFHKRKEIRTKNKHKDQKGMNEAKIINDGFTSFSNHTRQSKYNNHRSLQKSEVNNNEFSNYEELPYLKDFKKIIS